MSNVEARQDNSREEIAGIINGSPVIRDPEKESLGVPMFQI